MRRALWLWLALFPATVAAQVITHTTSDDFARGVSTRLVPVANDAGALQLGAPPVRGLQTVWSINYLYGYVVKLDARTGKQLGRYDSRIAPADAGTVLPPPQEYCDFASTGNCPGRLALDEWGDAWVVNRAFGKQGSLTRIAGSRERCIDRNDSGVIETSVDVSNDGFVSVLPDAGEYFGPRDECVLSTVGIGPNNSYPRGVAIDRRGNVWVSTWVDGKLMKFAPTWPVPTLVATITLGGNPYSLAAAGDYVYVSSSTGNLVRRVNILTHTMTSVTCAFSGTYGIVADPATDTAWLGGYPGGNGVYRANFVNNTCTVIATGSQVTGVTEDLAGNVWACGYTTNTVHKISPAGVILGTYPAGGTSPHGMAVDLDGNLWVVNHGPVPNLTKLNVNTGAIIGTYPLSGPGIPNPDPYNYADFTGQQLARQQSFVSSGAWTTVADAGFPRVPWARVTWNTEDAGVTPPGTELAVTVRAADTVGGLGGLAFSPTTNGAALSGVSGQFVEVRVAFLDGGLATPVLSDLSLVGVCAQPAEACCLASSHCDDLNACTTDSCPDAGLACTHAAISGCCNRDPECDDGNACTADTCSGDGGSCTRALITGCCNVSADCNDGNACTTDTCSGDGGTCTRTPIAGCCNVDADCGDRNACTTDNCSGDGGTCTRAPIAGCCNVNADCSDGNACTTDTCSGDGGTCTRAPIAGCCNVNADCNDGNACTADTCSGDGGTCTRAPIAGCCNVSADCNDNDVCTTDACSGDGGTCTHAAVGMGCCRGATDCDDQNACTTDTCEGTMRCGHAAISGCCRTATDCGAGQECASGACRDAVVDAGGSEVDGGATSADGGTGTTVKPGSCGCGASGLGAGAWAALLLARALVRRRRAQR